VLSKASILEKLKASMNISKVNIENVA
jgi:hypothetical protein